MKSLAAIEHLNVVNDILYGFFPGPIICDKNPLGLQAGIFEMEMTKDDKKLLKEELNLIENLNKQKM